MVNRWLMRLLRKVINYMMANQWLINGSPRGEEYRVVGGAQVVNVTPGGLPTHGRYKDRSLNGASSPTSISRMTGELNGNREP